MMRFAKYQGAGNDFILIDNRALFFDPKIVKHLCHRKFGIGADGVILLQNDPVADFRMRIFNSDGSEAGSCGNGLRCLVRFIQDLGIAGEQFQIAAGDRIVKSQFLGEKISIQMGPAQNVEQHCIEGRDLYSLDTGVPHLVFLVPDVHQIDISKEGPLLRHHPSFQPSGANVNFASLHEDGFIEVRTYERGVEGETMACGTGASAVGAIVSRIYGINPIGIRFPGGEVEICMDNQDIFLIGDAVKVFEGFLTP